MLRKIRLFYYNNKNKIWKTIGLIALVIVIILILNQLARKDILDNLNNVQSASENTNQRENQFSSIYNPTQSAVDNTQVSGLEKDDVTNLLVSFLDYCVDGNPKEAYNLISSDCKDVLYPTYDMFYNNYFSLIFSGKKTYTYQLWTASEEYIFLVKIMDNALDTGKISDEITQDYISIVRKNGNYFLNINSFISRNNQNLRASGSNIQITLKYMDSYMDDLVCTYIVNNMSEKDIALTRQGEEDIYLVDENELEYNADTNEMNPDDLVISAKTTKEIKIRFNCSYISDRVLTKIVFNNIVLDYQKYMQMENKDEYVEFLNLEM